jgi:hypothetical protein
MRTFVAKTLELVQAGVAGPVREQIFFIVNISSRPGENHEER